MAADCDTGEGKPVRKSGALPEAVPLVTMDP
jgi:hypothetical protein